MSISKRIIFGAGASWFSRIVTIIIGLLLMPVLFRHLPKEELGMWLLLGQSWAALGILDLGFGPTLIRRIAFAKGKSGSDPNAPLTDGTLHDIADLVASGQKVYQIISILAFLVSFGSGFFYLRSLELHTLSLPTVWLAWGIICLSQGINVWGNIWDCLLQGVGYVGWDAILGSFVNTTTLIVQIIAIFMGGGLMSLAVVAAVGAFAQRFVLRRFSRSKRPELFQLHGRWNYRMIRTMVAPALQSWVTSMGTVLLMSTDQYFIAGTGGVKDIPAYRAAYLLIYNLSSMSTTLAGASAVFISHLWQAAELRQVHRVVFRNLRFGLGIMAAGGACILVLGPRLFDLWLGSGNFIGYPCLVLFFAMLFSDAQSYIISTSSRATEDEAYGICSISGGILKLILAWLLGARFGLIGIAASTLIAQLLTNHWYMVFRGLRRLQIGFKAHLAGVILPVAGLFGVVFLMVSLTVSVGVFSSGLPSLLAATLMSSLLLAGYFWNLVIEADQRTRLIQWARDHLFILRNQ